MKIITLNSVVRYPHHFSLRTRCLTLGLAALVLAGCSRVGGDGTQVAAKVNDGEISVAQLQSALRKQPGVSPERSDALTRRVLDNLIEQELAAQAARKAELDRDPRVVQAMELAKREVLAKAYQDSFAEKVTMPTGDDVDRYYDAHPALFAKRRFYTMQEFTVQAPSSEVMTVKSKLETAQGPAQLTDVLRGARLPFSNRQVTMAPEDIPLQMLGSISDLREGQSLVVPFLQGTGARILVLLSAQPAPLTRDFARPSIQLYLTNERKMEAYRKSLKTLRDEAKIDLMIKTGGPLPSALEKAASGASAASAAPAASAAASAGKPAASAPAMAASSAAAVKPGASAAPALAASAVPATTAASSATASKPAAKPGTAASAAAPAASATKR